MESKYQKEEKTKAQNEKIVLKTCYFNEITITVKTTETTHTVIRFSDPDPLLL
jgi:hypothetical protein